MDPVYRTLCHHLLVTVTSEDSVLTVKPQAEFTHRRACPL